MTKENATLYLAGGVLLWKSKTAIPGFTTAFSTKILLEQQGPRKVDYGFYSDTEKASAARRYLCEQLCAPPENLILGSQVHGSRVEVVTRDNINYIRNDFKNLIADTDAIVTDLPGVPLAVLTADCAPALMIDPARGVVAAVHAGWKGAVLGILENTITVLSNSFSSKAADVKVLIGPSIGPCCLEVKEDLISELHQEDRKNLSEKDGRSYLNLWKLCTARLEAAGVRPENISLSNLCTKCHPELFYSYRGDNGRAGSNISIVMKKEK